MIAYLGDVIHFCFKEPNEGDHILQDVTFESELGDKNKQGITEPILINI